MDTEQLTTASGWDEWTHGLSAVAFEVMANQAAQRHENVAELLTWTAGLGDAAAARTHGSAVLVTASDVAADAVLGLGARHQSSYRDAPDGWDGESWVPVVYVRGSDVRDVGFEEALEGFYGHRLPKGRGAAHVQLVSDAVRDRFGTSMLLLDGLDELGDPGALPTFLRALHLEVPMLVVAVRRTVDRPRTTAFGKVQPMAAFRLFMRHVDVRDIDPDDFR